MNSDVEVDGSFNFRHRVVGALVLVILGIVVLPIILNGASMTKQVVEIDKAHGEKQPRTFETNIRPVGTDDSAVKVDSESEDQLEAKLSFPKPDAPEIKPENAPQSTGTQMAPADSANLNNIDSNNNAATGTDTAQVAAPTEDKTNDEQTVAAESPGGSEGTLVAKIESESSEIIPLPEVDPKRVLRELNNESEGESDTSRKQALSDAEPVDLNANPKADSSVPKPDQSAKASPDQAGQKAEGNDATDEKPGADAGKDSSTVTSESSSESEKRVTGVTGWVVRVGTFGEAANAARMVDLLNSKGFTGQSSISKTKSGKALTRVWVGPFDNRADASQKLAKIEQTTGEKGFVTAYP